VAVLQEWLLTRSGRQIRTHILLLAIPSRLFIYFFNLNVSREEVYFELSSLEEGNNNKYRRFDFCHLGGEMGLDRHGTLDDP
jgi:hypothetical protein